MRGLVFFFIISLVLIASLQGQSSTNLFWIERNRDANRIYYDLNVDESGKLNARQPIKPYWIKHAEDGRKESLTWIQRQLAYGLKFLEVTNTETEFQFVSYKDASLLLKKEGTEYTVYFKHEKDLITVQRIFVQIDGGPFLMPIIPYIQITGIDPNTNQIKQLTIKP